MIKRSVKNIFLLFKSGFIPSLAASVLVFLLGFLPLFSSVDRRFLDLSFRIRGPQAPHPDIVILEINDESLQKLGAWPWPRSYYGALLEVLAKAKPSVIFFDILFSEKSSKKQDAVFAQGLKNAGNVVLPFYFSVEGQSLADPPQAMPIEMFRDPAARLGFVNVIPDADGHVRQIIPEVLSQNHLYEHASLAIANIHRRSQGSANLDFKPGVPLLINFPGPYSHFSLMGFQDLILSQDTPKEEALAKLLKDKIVLIGHTAVGASMDLKPTAFASQYPGVGVQASIVHTFLTGRFIRRIPDSLLFGFLLFFALFVRFLTGEKNPMRCFAYILCALALFFVSAQAAFQLFRLWVPALGFFLIGVGTYLWATLASFIRIRIEREVMRKELNLASNIQKTFLPAELPVLDGLDLAALTLPARHVGGDLYDLLTGHDNGTLGVCIGDVSGKGVPAALFMAKAISEFRREAGTGTPAEVVGRLNNKMAREGSGGLFLTLLYLSVDPKAKKVFFANGGHEAIYHYKKSDNSVSLVNSEQGLPLGIDPDGLFDLCSLDVQKGDVLLLQTDGVKEAKNKAKEMFGNSRVGAALLEKSGEPAAAILENLLKQIQSFVGKAPQHDDLTLVCVKFTE